MAAVYVIMDGMRRGLGLVLWLVLLLGTLACLPLRCTSDLPEVKEASPISPEQAKAVGERLGRALEGEQPVIQLTVTQDEVNSLLGGMLPQEKGQDQGLPLSSVEVRLHPGEVELLAGLASPCLCRRVHPWRSAWREVSPIWS